MIKSIIENNDFDISILKIFNIGKWIYLNSGEGLLLVLTIDFIILLNRNNQTIDWILQCNLVKHISQGIQKITVTLNQSTIYHLVQYLL